MIESAVLLRVGDIDVRRAGPNDADVLGALRASQRGELRGGEPAELDRFAAVCASFFARELAAAQPWLHGWLARRGERVVGCTVLTILPTLPRFDAKGHVDGRIRDVFVVASERRRGIARALVGLAITEARERGVDRLALGSSDMGRPLYEALGFIAKSDEMLYVAR